MPKMRIRDFSGGLVTNQSEFDLQENQYTVFSKVKNKKPGKLERPNVEQTISGVGDGLQKQTELVLYRTEKDGSNNDVSTQWWFYSSGVLVQRQDISIQRGINSVDDTTPTPSGAWQTGKSSSDQSPSSGSTTGTGATFDITTDGSGNPTFTITSPGSGYSVDDTLTFTDPGSTSSVATVTVATVKEFENVTEGWSGADVFADLFVHSQILRLSDSSFANASKWYGHVKRNVFGQSQTYEDGFRFEEPPMQALVNNWYVQDLAITAPTVVPMIYAFDQNDDINAANEIGIFVHFPAGSGDDTILIPDVDTGTFSSKDKYTCTFVYDYVQESALGKDANGDIGVPSLNTVVDGNCPGIQLVMFTGTDLASFNPRITAVNLYWQPEDDVDWYLVGSYDIDKGFSEDPRAKNSSTDVVTRLGTAKTNNGYWIPCAEPFNEVGGNIGAANYEDIDAATANTFRSADSTWGAGFSPSVGSEKMLFVHPDNSTASFATNVTNFAETATIIAAIKSASGAYVTTGKVTSGSGVTVNWKNWIGEEYAQTPFSFSSARAFATSIATDKVATWYLPHDGLKLATYNSLTGRAAETPVNSIKWNTAAVVNNRAYYGNVDTVDENSQTARANNRVYYTDPFKYDEIMPGRFFDVGRNDGDIIIKMCAYRDRLFIFKKNNTYIYNVRRQMEKIFVGVGAQHKHAVFETPLGIVCSNKSGIYSVTHNAVRELSYPIRDTYQGLTFDEPMIGYDGVDNELLFVPDTNATTIYVMNMDNGSWVLRDIESAGQRSNFVISDDLRAQYLEVD